jgi:ATP-dependent Zn protease
MGAAKMKKLSTAWHEAGHLVVGLHFNLQLNWASIMPRHTEHGTYEGGCEWASLSDEDGKCDFSAWVCEALAGPLVDKRRGSHVADLDDIAKIRAMAWAYLAASGSDKFVPDARSIPRLAGTYLLQPERVPLKVRQQADAMIANCLPEAERIITEQWDEIERVADLLLRRTVLTPEDLHADWDAT